MVSAVERGTGCFGSGLMISIVLGGEIVPASAKGTNRGRRSATFMTLRFKNIGMRKQRWISFVDLEALWNHSYSFVRTTMISALT